MQVLSGEDGHRREANSDFTLNWLGKASSAALCDNAEKRRVRFLGARVYEEPGSLLGVEE